MSHERHLDDRLLWGVLSQSVVGRTGRALVAATRRAAAESLVVAQGRRGWSTWNQWSARDRFRFVGAMAMSAGGTIAILTDADTVPAAWRLAIPAAMVTYGAIVLVLSVWSGAQRSRE